MCSTRSQNALISKRTKYLCIPARLTLHTLATSKGRQYLGNPRTNVLSDNAPAMAIHSSTRCSSLAGKGESLLEGSSATLYPDGHVVWAPSALLEAYCQLDLRRWPFEQHQCSLSLGSWTLDTNQLKIGNVSHRLEVRRYRYPRRVGLSMVGTWPGPILRRWLLTVGFFFD